MNEFILDNTKYLILKRFEENRLRKFSKVYLVESADTKSKLIFKLVNKSNSKTNEIKVLLNEYSCLNDLNQEVRLIERENDLILSKKFDEGISLKDFYFRVKNKNQFFKNCMIKLVEELNELHIKRWIHGDIQESNIIIQGNEENFEVKLIDFGMSRKIGNNSALPFVFSLKYSAPEFILNRGDLSNTSSDFYSLGLMMYHLIEGQFPFKSANPSILTNLQVVHPIQSYSKMSYEFFELLIKMTSKPKLKNAPIHLSNEEIEFAILEAQQKRLNQQEIINELKNIENIVKPKNRLIQFFSKSKI